MITDYERTIALVKCYQLKCNITFADSLKNISKKYKEKHVLIVDDIYSNRIVIREMLKKLNIPSVEASNGMEAIEVITQSFLYDSEMEIKLILMDINMPIMDGVEATVKIREYEDRSRINTKIPIVAVTAHDGNSNKDLCIKAGMQHYVLKPINSYTLKKIITKFASEMIT